MFHWALEQKNGYNSSYQNVTQEHINENLFLGNNKFYSIQKFFV